MLKDHSLRVFIGTKAQYIKTAPLLRLMQEKKISYNLIDSGQHAEFANILREELGVKEPDVYLEQKGNIKSVKEVVFWFVRYLILTLFNPSRLRKEVFKGKQGICIIHGDTPSTFVALMLAKRIGLKVAHIEAGLRSYNFFKPFPEEIIRIFCMKFSDYLFSPSDWAYENLVKMGVKGEKFNVKQNTNVEAMYYSLEKTEKMKTDKEYCLMTIHRVETILRKQRLCFVIDLAEKIAKNLQVFFVLHDPTLKKLKDFGLLERITNNTNIYTSGLMDHSKFLALLSNANFVITDGGSIQEESHYLDVPCLVMRTETERQEGIGSNVKMSNFTGETVESFLQNYKQFKRGRRIGNMQPSLQILNTLLYILA